MRASEGADSTPGMASGRPRATPATTGAVSFTAHRALRRFSGWPFSVAVLAAIILPSIAARAQSAAETVIRNVASASFDVAPGVSGAAASNATTLTVVATRTRSKLELLRTAGAAPSGVTLGPTQCLVNGAFQPSAAPVPIGGAPLDPTQPAQTAAATVFHDGEPLVVRVEDADQNRDPAALDSVEVDVSSPDSGDRERLRLVETGIDTGVFIGYVNTSAGTVIANDCLLEVPPNAKLAVSYRDRDDNADLSVGSGLVDPLGVVFDSRTGLAVNGARVRLIDASTGQPAKVLGDDGRSSYPAEVVSGAQATDAGGTVYSFAPGGYRFPLVAPGSYRVDITPPSGYAFPSQVSVAVLQALPGAPFAINPGSFGADYPIVEPPAVAIDVPLDPTGTQLFLQKSTAVALAAVGDFVQYALNVENSGATGTFPSVALTDVLPEGFRYRHGSARIDGKSGGAPAISADGRTLSFSLTSLAPGERHTVHYVAEVTIATRAGRAVNRALAIGFGNVASNDASVAVQIRNDLFRERSFLVGRVVEGDCKAPPADVQGVANVRVYLEDGSYSLTDSEGKYHFEGLPPGTHIVQVDTDSVPEELAPVDCADSARHAGRGYSQFVDLRAGALWRADFRLAHRTPPRGSVALKVRSQANAVTAQIMARDIAIGHAKLMLMLPAGVGLGANALGEMHEGIASIDVGEIAAGQTRELTVPLAGSALVAGKLRAVLVFDSPTVTAQASPALDLDLVSGEAHVDVETRGLFRPRALIVPSTPLRDVSRPNTKFSVDIETLRPGLAWLYPTEDTHLDVPTAKVILQHLPEHKITLLLNGKQADALNFDGTQTNAAKTVSVAFWRGLDLKQGDNELIAIVEDGEGHEIRRLIKALRYGDGAVHAELVEASSVLLADGRTRPVLALRMTDTSGATARPGTVGAFHVDLPYRSRWDVDSLKDNQLVQVGRREPTYTVEADGIARIELEPTTQAGSVTLRLRFNERQSQEIRAWLKPAARDWIMVGIAEGTAAYQHLAAHKEAAPDVKDGFDDSGRVAFFAKGAIRGDYLLTVAYDSARDREAARARLNGVIEPDRYYTLYGDGTEQRYEAASQRKLYLKLERNQFVALFGDFETGFTITELSRYSRTMNGFKTDYRGAILESSAFASRSDQGFVRDEIAGDGTSGLYHLTRAPLVAGSDKLRIETRDRFHLERVLDIQQLTPFVDYQIDYLAGTVFFKRPVPGRSVNFNPVFIVAEYEARNAGGDDASAGGRAVWHVGGGKVDLGATAIHEGRGTTKVELGGADLRWRASDKTEARLELALTKNNALASGERASAYIAEVKHLDEKLEATAYVREQQAGFGLGQQSSTESGSRKTGADARWHFQDRWYLQSQLYRQQFLEAGARRDLAEGELRYEESDRSVGLGLREVKDVTAANGTQQSSQAFVSGSTNLWGSRFALRASHETELGGKNASIDFPTRSVLGLDYHYSPDVTMFGEYEHADGEHIKTDMTRFGVRATPWDRAHIDTSIAQAATEFGPRTFANLGLTQGWQLDEHWALDAGVDQSHTIKGAAAAPLAAQQPIASGNLNEDYFATYVGTLYRSELWTYTSRIEYRDATAEDKWIFTGGFYREPIKGHAFSLSLQLQDSKTRVAADATVADARLSWAYRPADAAWILLDRFDLIYDRQSGAAVASKTWRYVNNFHANRLVGERGQLGLQYGGRYARSQFDEASFTGYTDLYGLDVRWALDSRFDIGAQAAVENSWNAGVRKFSAGVEFGVTFAKNVWLSIGYNLVGFQDADFSASRYTAQGPFIKLRVKADQDTFKELQRSFIRGESTR
jgi:uncharacterized repeat protein (TIGR01451 family)